MSSWGLCDAKAPLAQLPRCVIQLGGRWLHCCMQDDSHLRRSCDSPCPGRDAQARMGALGMGSSAFRELRARVSSGMAASTQSRLCNPLRQELFARSARMGALGMGSSAFREPRARVSSWMAANTQSRLCSSLVQELLARSLTLKKNRAYGSYSILGTHSKLLWQFWRGL